MLTNSPYNRNLHITASEMHKVMGDKLDNDTAMRLVYQKVAQELGGRISEYTSPEMQWGIENEELALKWCRKLIAADVHKPDTGQYEGIILASPDGYSKEKNAVFEIKCPNSDTHIKYACNIYDNDSMQKTAKEYYYQIQTQMLVFDVQRGYFVSFDPRMGQSAGFRQTLILADTDAQKKIIESSLYYTEKIKQLIKKLS